MSGLVAATIIAGVLLIVMGIMRLGALIRFVPHTITTGFTAGVVVTIVLFHGLYRRRGRHYRPLYEDGEPRDRGARLALLLR
ncbi:MAG: SulP family inorganic anion transporter [Collinsella tanakaei]